MMLPLPLVATPFLLFWVGAGALVGTNPSGKLRLIGFCRVFNALGVLLTSVVCHVDFPPGISEGRTPGEVI